MNNKNTELLPLGSIVYLQEGTQKLMIIGRELSLTTRKLEKKHSLTIWVFCTQWAFERNRHFSFNMKILTKSFFVGYSDEEEGRFLEVYEKWTKTLTVPKKEIK